MEPTDAEKNNVESKTKNNPVHHPHHSEKAAHVKESVKTNNLKNNTKFWQAASAVLAILLLISVFSNQTVSSSAGTNSKTLNQQDFSLKMKNFIQESLTQNAAEVSIENLTEENGLYKFAVLVNGNLAALSYATKDGEVLFPQALEVEKVKAAAAEAAKNPAANGAASTEVTKSDKPVVQLFVMSQCPYGVQAENSMKPVLDALKDKISFELRFIANADGKGGFSSLHGQAEVDEDLRQVCAAKYYPAAYMDYVICRNANIRSTDWQACATESKLDSAKIKTCSEGTEGKALLTENIKLADELNVGGSPTIKINSGAYNGQRTADAFLGGICAAFNNAPAECSKALGASAAQTAEVPAGGCGA